MAEDVILARVPHLYSVTTETGTRVDFFASLDETADTIERAFPGGGARYRAFVAKTRAIHGRARTLLLQSHPSPVDALRSGSWRDALSLLEQVLAYSEGHITSETVNRAIGTATAFAPNAGISKATAALAAAPVKSCVTPTAADAAPARSR